MEKVHFVIFREDSVWVAHGLEHNIVTVGGSKAEIKENIDAILEAYRSDGLISQVPVAPQEYWDRYLQALQAQAYLEDHLEDTDPEPELLAHELDRAA